MSDVAETLDPLRLPLQGERLIEASAGTGKTFTIAALYLRLLLGLGGSAAFPRPLTVEELLVVTFTEAATAELRGRIRSNIHELRIACLRETTDNPLYRKNAAEDKRYELKESSNGKFYFNLKAVNGQVIGTSPMFGSAEARDAVIAQVKSKAATAGVVEDL